MCAGTRLLREVEVEDYDSFQVGDYYVFYVFVDGVGEVFVAGGGAVEGHDEAVGVVVIETFAGIVGAEVEIQEAGDFSDHVAHGFEAVGDGFFCGSGFELEASVVFYFWHFLTVV